MPTKIFVNLPVQDLSKSMEFFTKLGYNYNPQFTNHEAACMIIAEDILVMLLTHEKFKLFTPYPISDAHKTTEVLVCLSCDSRKQVEDIVKTANSAGAKIHKEPQDYSFMYGHGFQDLDGHIWELIWMDPAAVMPKT